MNYDVQRIRHPRNPDDVLEWRRGSGDTVELLDIVVRSERRKGHGTHLVKQLMKKVPKTTTTVFAITRSDNFIAQQFYEKLGWRVVGVLRDFYHDVKDSDVDAVMYGITLNVLETEECDGS